MRVTLSVVAAAALLVACDSPARAPAPEPASGGPTASGPRPFQPPSDRTLPGVDRACQRDDDCAVFDDVLTGETACCPGCVPQVGAKASLAAFRAACAAAPAPMCPPLGCAMQSLAARCVSGVCAVR